MGKFVLFLEVYFFWFLFEVDFEINYVLFEESVVFFDVCDFIGRLEDEVFGMVVVMLEEEFVVYGSGYFYL